MGPNMQVSLLSHSVKSNSFCNAVDCSPPGSSIPWDFPEKNSGVGCHFLLQIPGDLSDPVIELASPTLAGRFFTTELSGKPPACSRCTINILGNRNSERLQSPSHHCCCLFFFCRAKNTSALRSTAFVRQTTPVF